MYRNAGNIIEGATSYVAYMFTYFPLNALQVICVCGIYDAFRGIFITGTYVVVAWKLKWHFVVILLICTVIWSPYVDYSTSAVGHAYAVWQAYLVWGIYE